MNSKTTINRRSFLQGSASLGAGLVIGFHIQPKRAQAQAPAPANYPPNAFVRIGSDNTVTVISKHTEMGQGIYTGLATIMAEELDADWSQMRTEAAPAAESSATWRVSVCPVSMMSST